MATPPAPRASATLAAADTLAGYDRWSATYDEHDNPAIAGCRWLLGQRPLAVRDLDVLELGCGTGRHAPEILAGGARSYTGVDGSPEMLAVAARRTTDARAQWLTADLLAAWEPPRRYDLALVVLVLEHLPTLTPLANTLAAAVRPGGALRILDLHRDRLAAGSVAQFTDAAGEVVFTSVAHASADIVAALTAVGFDVALHEERASGDLVAAVPKLGKQPDARVLIDVVATRR